jgi:hypothetical protein
MAKESLFKDGVTGKAFIESNQSMKIWLGKLNSERTKDTYAYAMWQFSQWAKKTPDELLAERKAEDEETKTKKASKGYDTLDLLQDFIKHGVVHTKRTYRTGTVTEKTIKIGEKSRNRRVTLYAILKSFYVYNLEVGLLYLHSRGSQLKLAQRISEYLELQLRRPWRLGGERR